MEKIKDVEMLVRVNVEDLEAELQLEGLVFAHERLQMLDKLID